jgi:hypothetical protein
MVNEMHLSEDEIARVYTKREILQLASKHGAHVIAREGKIDRYKIIRTYDDSHIRWWKDNNLSEVLRKVIIVDVES